MCGILAAYDQKGRQVDLTNLRKGLAAIRHRGPDASSDRHDQNIYLGHNRLSIIDLSESANQPLKSVHADAWIIFNGEIYNYKELKVGLQGINFHTTSDTEVILEGYLNEGVTFFKKLRGMYAFVILDYRQGRREFTICRDPSGIKSLYYYYKDGLLLVGSEIKALLPAIPFRLTPNRQVIQAFLHLSFCPEPYTAFEEIKALEPGTLLRINNREFSQQKFYSFNFEDRNTNSYKENKTHVKEYLSTALMRNLVADVEVSVALSGGIDSSLLYALAHKADTQTSGITVKFKDSSYDEADVATIYAKTLNGRQEIIEVDRTFSLNTLDDLLLHFDQPYADSSAIPVYYLTKAVQSKTKVLIGGDGGDELFNGYSSMPRLNFLNRLKQTPLGKELALGLIELGEKVASADRKRELHRLSDLIKASPDDMLFDIYSWFPRQTRLNDTSAFHSDPREGLWLYNNLFQESMLGTYEAKILMTNFRKRMLSDYLRKTEFMSMKNSVEYRVPFLDEDLTQYALSIPFSQKSTLRKSKIFLRDIHREIYPSKTSSIPKSGFSIPLDSYLGKEEFREIQKAVIRPDSIVASFIRQDYINFLFKVLNKEVIATDTISRASVYQRILTLYSLHLWAENKL